MPESWKNFFILYSIQFLQLLDFMSISPLGGLFVKEAKFDSSTISFALATYSVAAILSSLFVGNVGRKEPKKTLLGSLILFSVSQLVLMLPITSLLFVCAKALGGLTGGLMGAIAYSQLNSIEQGKNTGLWNGRIQTAQSLAVIIGIPFCLIIVSSLGSKAYFMFMTCWSFLTLLFFNRANFFLSTERNELKLNFSFAVQNLDIIFSGFLVYLAAFLFISHMANYFLNHLQTSASELSISYAISGSLTLLLAGFIGQFAERKSAAKLLSLSVIAIMIPQLLFIQSSDKSLLLYLAVPLYLLVSNARAIYQRSLILEKKAKDSFLLHLLNNIAVRIGILTSGIVLAFIAHREHGVDQLFRIANIASIVVGLGVLVGLRLTSTRLESK